MEENLGRDERKEGRRKKSFKKLTWQLGKIEMNVFHIYEYTLLYVAYEWRYAAFSFLERTFCFETTRRRNTITSQRYPKTALHSTRSFTYEDEKDCWKRSFLVEELPKRNCATKKKKEGKEAMKIKTE
mgnify:CR=1 FL=1